VLSKLVRTAILGIAASAALSLGVKAASAEAALLIDAESGRVLFAENATSPWYPASVTKIMTAYVTLKAVKEGRLSLDKLLTVSENAVAQQPSKMGFPVGTQVTVDNALKMLMVKSANDMAVVLAEGLSGSIESFATEMNRAAERLGMTQTSYVNPNGLPADGQVTSARDLAILARAAIREMPEYGLYWHISAIKFGKRVMRNYNTLIDRYPGADGMKTGFICASGFNLVATATRGSRRLIAVVLGSRSGMQRAEKAAQLLERGFAGGGGLSWLIPSFGTVDALQAVEAAPPNLRDEICNAKGRRKWVPSDNDEEPVTHTAEGSDSPLAMMAGFQLGPAKQGSLIGPLQPSMAPIPVYTGPARSPQAIELASAPAAKKKPPRKTAAPSGTTSPSQTASTSSGDPKAKTPPAQRPVGSSSNAAPAKPAAAVQPAPSTDPARAAKPKPKAKPVATKQPNNG
jgi:D-alanyl-D-alanine carboxypeptidase